MLDPSWIHKRLASGGAGRLQKNVIVAKVKEQYYEY